MSYKIYMFYIIICFFTFNIQCKKDPFVNECQAFDNIITIDSDKKRNKVLIVGIDGIRSDVISNLTSPFFAFLFD